MPVDGGYGSSFAAARAIVRNGRRKGKGRNHKNWTGRSFKRRRQ